MSSIYWFHSIDLGDRVTPGQKPAELLATSKVVTTKADKDAELFTGIASSLAPGFPLYLPHATLDDPRPLLPMLVSIGKAFWTARRQPAAIVYKSVAAVAPTSAFVLVGQPSVVNFQVQGGTYVVPKVLERGYLALGKERFDFQQGR